MENSSILFTLARSFETNGTLGTTSSANQTFWTTAAGVEDLRTPFQKTMDQVFLVTMAMLIQLMQCGFAFLEVGCVRSKNVTNIMMKTLLDVFVAGIAYWTLGFAFAYGEGNSFIGWKHFASSGLPDGKFAYFFYEFVIASTASTIVSGAVAERCEMVAYLVYSFVLTAFVYPVVSRWAWSDYGWLFKGMDYVFDGQIVNIGYHDFAGSAVVHSVGGTASFFGAMILGPRIGRFHDKSNTAVPIRGHSIAFPSLGIMILLIGFLAFNGGSQMSVSSPGDGDVISLAIVNTVISACMSAYVSLILHKCGLLGNTWDVMYTVNGALIGMVAICTGCNVLRPWAAAIVGIVAGFVFNFLSWLMCKLKIDDPVDAVAVHFGGGAWGVISYALLEYEHGVLANWNKRSALILGWQLAGWCSIVLWTSCICGVMFTILKYSGYFRVPEELERKGLDIPKHGTPAYPLDAYGHGHKEKILMILENGELSTFTLGFHSGFCHEQEKTGFDYGPYECPEVKVLNHIHAKMLPEVEMNRPPCTDALNNLNCHSNGNCQDTFERTAL